MIWFFFFISIFCGTILILFVNIQKIVTISENLVEQNFEISSTSKKMIENLLAMEESSRKYKLLKKDIYIQQYISSRTDFSQNLNTVLEMGKKGKNIAAKWKWLDSEYQRVALNADNTAHQDLWIPEDDMNRWIQIISGMQTQNEKLIEQSTRELNRQSQMSSRNALIGLALSGMVGLVGILFLSYSMIRPLKELLKGIRSISKDRFSKPIQVRSKDEFGKLADAFNTMAVQLKEEERMRSDFIGMLSHEIRTPLTSTRESVNMIAEEVMGAINERQRKFLEIASTEIGRICDLLNHLMQVSRLESLELNIRKQSINTNTFVSGCINRLSYVANTKNIHIDASIPSELPSIHGDPEYLQRVFYNLLENAIKFSESGSRVSVRIKPAKNRSMLLFFIKDNGPGVPEEEQTLIFNKYYQAKGTRDHIDGVGLGLNISKHIIEAHDGNIWVESKNNQGSTFCFSLPIAGH
ncbi:MAG: sensor histidine kinase [Desulfobacteraceae bacterium]|nr:MAG: sensor histidine kinase [Desulfobacteraceae bacterium]